MQQFGVLNRKKNTQLDLVWALLLSVPVYNLSQKKKKKPFAEVYTFPSSNGTDQEIHSIFRN